MKPVQIKVNVINEMKKLRDSAYGDRLAWVEELIQNTQRAGADKVNFRLNSNTVEVEDNGVGLTDPQDLFEKSTSGWGEEINSQNPFGEGFFSTLMISDLITVASVGFTATFDVEKMFKENTLDVIEIEKTGKTRGFRVILHKLNEDYDEWDTEERIREVAQYIKGIDFYIDGELIKYKDFNETDNSKFSKIVDNEYFTGWLRPFKWGYGSESDGYGGDAIQAFAQERYVKDMSYYGLDGRILFKDGKVDLRSPDRKEIINNSKYTYMKETLSAEVKSVMLDIIKKGNDKDLDKYASAIDRYVEVEEYEKYMKFIYTDDYDKFEEIMNKLREMQEQGEKVDFNQIAELLDYEGVELQEEVILESGIEDTPFDTLPTEERETTGTRTGGEIKENPLTFYVKLQDLENYREKLALAHYHSIPVILIRNVLEQKVLESKSGFLPLKELRENVQLSAHLKKVGAIDEVEERALWVLGVVSRGLGFNNNVFKIGDMTTYKETKVGDKETIKEIAPALAVARGNEIYIDRGCLKKGGLEVSKVKRITNADRTFIASNMEVLAHELSHIMKGTTDNTKEHAEAQVEITNIILQGLFT